MKRLYLLVYYLQIRIFYFKYFVIELNVSMLRTEEVCLIFIIFKLTVYLNIILVIVNIVLELNVQMLRTEEVS